MDTLVIGVREIGGFYLDSCVKLLSKDRYLFCICVCPSKSGTTGTAASVRAPGVYRLKHLYKVFILKHLGLCTVISGILVLLDLNF